jgi:hypothetical protein
LVTIYTWHFDPPDPIETGDVQPHPTAPIGWIHRNVIQAERGFVLVAGPGLDPANRGSNISTGSLDHRIPESGNEGQADQYHCGIPRGNPGKRRKEILLQW